MENKKYFYIGRKEALNNESYVLKISKNKIKNFKKLYGDNCIEFFGENLPPYVTVEGDLARESTISELYARGVYKLKSDEFIKDDKVYTTKDFHVDEDIICPVFDKNQMRWIESASLDNIIKHWFDRCMECSNMLSNIERLGFKNSYDYLKYNEELEEYRRKYIDATHELALSLNTTTKRA